MATCPECGATNREGARYCDACGSALETSSSSTSRRVVTVLFSDITGSTELGERLDPERMRQVLTRYFDTMRSVIERHGGTVEKFIGDAVMAVFGIPRIHEDDALRAVRAAADISDALDAMNDDLEATHGVRIRTRTGVNTGEVMVDERSGESLVTGDVVNVAARFEQRAEPGEVLLGEETYRLVRDAILADPVEPMELKGKAEPVIAYRLLKVDPSAAGFARRLDAPMVGRERELALLRGAFDRAVSDNACQLFTVLGVGGVGKSRLVAAFVDGLGDRATVLRGRCLPYGEGITFWPVIEAVGQVVGLAAADDPETATARIAALIPDDDHAERIARQVAQVVGVDTGDAGSEETLWAIRRLLEGMARSAPVAFVIDDIQWAEPTMLELIEYVSDWSVDSPILLACMARPEILEARPGWGGGKMNATSIALEPLSTDECEILVRNLLAIERVDPAVIERIALAAEGHPLFAEEMLAMLVDEGRVTRVDGSWVASGDLSDLAVPPTTSALLAARIDRLGPDERITLERASVMGQLFYREALGSLSGEALDERALASLVRKQFVRPERSDLSGTEALAFRHLLIRDAAYEGITKGERARLHERFADWLGTRTPEQQELIGHHLERAAAFLSEVGPDGDRVAALQARAAANLAVAGDRALDRNDIPATINLLTRTMSLLRADDPARVSAGTNLGMALYETGEMAEGDRILAEAVSAASLAGPEEPAVARARMARSLMSVWGSMRKSEFEGRVEEAKRELEVLEAAGDALGAAYACAILGHGSWAGCHAMEARAAWRRGVDLARLAGDEYLGREYLSWLSATSSWGPTPCAEALVELEGFLAEAGGSLVAEAEIRDSMATPLWMLGRFDEARQRAEAAHRVRHELGRSVADAHSSQALAWLELMEGNVETAERILGEAAATLESMNVGAGGIIKSMRAMALYQLGRYQEAGDLAGNTLDLEVWDVATNYLALSVYAMVAARHGEFERAESMAREALEMIDDGDFINDQADTRMALAEVLELAGRPEEAGEVVREALDRYRAKGNLTQAATAEARLAELAG